MHIDRQAGVTWHGMGRGSLGGDLAMGGSGALREALERKVTGVAIHMLAVHTSRRISTSAPV
jgi:hypothetical protein